jgi:hypothetical protein
MIHLIKDSSHNRIYRNKLFSLNASRKYPLIKTNLNTSMALVNLAEVSSCSASLKLSSLLKAAIIVGEAEERAEKALYQMRI